MKRSPSALLLLVCLATFQNYAQAQTGGLAERGARSILRTSILLGPTYSVFQETPIGIKVDHPGNRGFDVTLFRNLLSGKKVVNVRIGGGLSFSQFATNIRNYQYDVTNNRFAPANLWNDSQYTRNKIALSYFDVPFELTFQPGARRFHSRRDAYQKKTDSATDIYNDAPINNEGPNLDDDFYKDSASDFTPNNEWRPKSKGNSTRFVKSSNKSFSKAVEDDVMAYDPDRKPKLLIFALGFKGGVLFDAHTKLVQDARVVKEKRLNNINAFRYGPTARIGVGKFSAFGFYSLASIFDGGDLPDFAPITFGIMYGGDGKY